MNSVCLQLSRNSMNYIHLVYNVKRILQTLIPTISPFSFVPADISCVAKFTITDSPRKQPKPNNHSKLNHFSVRYFISSEIKKLDVTNASLLEIEKEMLDCMTKNRDKDLVQIILECKEQKKGVTEHAFKQLLRYYSQAGKTDIVFHLREYCSQVNPEMYDKNGNFKHFSAKAQCMKGNSEKGLLILKECFIKYEGLRSLYRVIFRELIHDSVSNRSEASLVIFKRHVLDYSDNMGDHYPLVCLWQVCWASNWFSDQQLAEELVNTSRKLQNIVRNKASAFSINILKHQYNEDAVIRLLQLLLKFNMMSEYVDVLQVLFNYKLRNRDIRGCSEIIRNCQALGVNLPSDQQGEYIRALIDGKYETKPSAKKPPTKNIKFKF